MSWKNSAERHGTVSIALHWLMALLMVGVYACIELHEFYGRTPTGAMFENWHSMLGLAILLLVLLRFGLRFVQLTPRIGRSVFSACRCRRWRLPTAALPTR